MILRSYQFSERLYSKLPCVQDLRLWHRIQALALAGATLGHGSHGLPKTSFHAILVQTATR